MENSNKVEASFPHTVPTPVVFKPEPKPVQAVQTPLNKKSSQPQSKKNEAQRRQRNWLRRRRKAAKSRQNLQSQTGQIYDKAMESPWRNERAPTVQQRPYHNTEYQRWQSNNLPPVPQMVSYPIQPYLANERPAATYRRIYGSGMESNAPPDLISSQSFSAFSHSGMTQTSSSAVRTNWYDQLRVHNWNYDTLMADYNDRVKRLDMLKQAPYRRNIKRKKSASKGTQIVPVKNQSNSTMRDSSGNPVKKMKACPEMNNKSTSEGKTVGIESTSSGGCGGSVNRKTRKPRNRNKNKKKTNSSPVSLVGNEDSPDPLKMAIVLDDFPIARLSFDQSSLIEEEMANNFKILEHGEFPQFSASYLEAGAYIVECANNETKKWVEETVPILAPWKDAKFQTGEKNNVLKKTVKVSLKAPTMYSKTDPCKILEVLGKQNSVLNTSEWKIVSCDTSDPTGQIIVVEIHISSLDALKSIGMKPFLGIGRILVTILKNCVKENKDPVKNAVEKNNDDPVKNAGEENNDDPLKDGGKESKYGPVKDGGKENKYGPVKDGGKENKYVPVKDGGEENNDDPLKDSGKENKYVPVKTSGEENNVDPLDKSLSQQGSN